MYLNRSQTINGIALVVDLGHYRNAGDMTFVQFAFGKMMGKTITTPM
jgi:hypothetical protein